MSEQDHKISSMIGIISSMAQEQEFFRNKLSNQFGEQELHTFKDLDTTKNIKLIEVSDDDSEEDDVSIDDSTDDDDNDDDDENDEEDDTENDNESNNDGNIKDLNISLGNDIINIESSDIDNLLDDDNDSDSIFSQSSEMTKAPTVKSIHLEEVISISENIDNLTSVNHDNMNYLKTLHLTVSEETDLKKMSVNKLRAIVIEKGLLEDPSKLKKPELLKLIEEINV
jgi:hypothetical protein